jgi:hypothetical protein
MVTSLVPALTPFLVPLLTAFPGQVVQVGAGGLRVLEHGDRQ